MDTIASAYAEVMEKAMESEENIQEFFACLQNFLDNYVPPEERN